MIEYALKYPIETVSVFITLFPILAMIIRMAYTHVAIRFLFYCLCCKMIIDGIMLTMAIHVIPNLILANFSVIVGYSFLSLMFYQTFERLQDKYMVVGLYSIFFAIFMYDIIDVYPDRSLRIAYPAECLFVIVLCIVYFYGLTVSMKVVNLFRHSMFWICSALVLYFSSSTFISPFYYELDQFSTAEGMRIFNSLTYLFEIFYLSVIGLGILISE